MSAPPDNGWDAAWLPITDRGPWVREPAWVEHTWWSGFYAGLLADDILLPPLCAYNLLCAVVGGAAQVPARIQDPRERAFWAELARRFDQAWPVLGDGAGRRSEGIKAAQRIAREFAPRFATEEDLEPFRVAGRAGLDPSLVRAAEEACLKPAPASAPDAARAALERVWERVRRAWDPEQGGIDALLPLEAPYEAWLGRRLDRTVGRHLNYDPGGWGPGVQRLSPLHGGGSLQELRPCDHGEFLKRIRGPLPRDLARLAPTELALLRSHWPYFVYRACEGGLEQRFFRCLRESRRRPAVHLRCELDLTDSSVSRLLGPDRPTVAAWYRATMIALVSRLAAVARSRWDLSADLAVLERGGTRLAPLSARTLERAGRSVREARHAVLAACPWAFFASSARSRTGVNAPDAGPRRGVDLSVRAALGPRRVRVGAGAVPGRREVLVRIERRHDGRWGFNCTEGGPDPCALDIHHLRDAGATPIRVAEEVLAELLGGLPAAAPAARPVLELR
jgi:hypothetical protein